MTTEKVSSKDYEAICHRLGFIPEVHFVRITRAGLISFTCGKPDWVRALLSACRREGLTPSRDLIEAARR